MRTYVVGPIARTIVLAGALVACSKETPAPPQQSAPSAAPNSAPSAIAPLTTNVAAAAPSAAPSASASVVPAEPTACPSADNWSSLSGFASDCGYVWTRMLADLPSPPEWGPCDVNNGAPINECKQFRRTGKVESLTAGANLAGKTQIGFVEHCPAPQIVIADADGPTRFALRSNQHSGGPSACMPKVLAVDLGRWVAALGGSQESDDPQYAMAIGNAYVGGQVGAAPGILHFQTKLLFDVRSADAYITSEGWFADDSKKRWNGKEFDKSDPFYWNYLTGKVVATAKDGFFVKTDTTPLLILAKPDDREYRHIRRREKQVAWIEDGKASSAGICWLVAADVDKSEMLAKVRRLGKITCAAQYFEIGCNSAVTSGDEGVFLVSLADGSTRKLDMKANVVSLDCKEAFFKQGDNLLRVALSAFGASQPAAEPPVELPLLTSTVAADAGVPDAAAPDASVPNTATPAASGSK